MDEHAVSVSLPKWAHVIGYEEGDTAVSSALACGYPRFVYHPYICTLMEHAKEDYSSRCAGEEKDVDCVLMPSLRAANRCRDFVAKACFDTDGGLISPDNCVDLEDTSSALDMSTQAHRKVKVLDLQACGIHAVIFPAETGVAIEAKSYWQHTGEIVSSRRASAALISLNIPYENITTKFKLLTCSSFRDPVAVQENGHMCLHPSVIEDTEPNAHNMHYAHSQVINRISEITKQPPSNVFLTPSGMQSVHAGLRLARRWRRQNFRHNPPSSQKGSSIVYGFPYLDTLKMCGRRELSDGVEFFGFGDERDLQNLKFMLNSRAKSSGSNDAGVTALITEFPSNPLLNIPDLIELRRLADEFNFVLIVDDTLGNFANVDLLDDGVADMICTSLTKIFNGRGDVVAGSVTISKDSKHGPELVKLMDELHGSNAGDLYKSDAMAILKNSQTFLQRSNKINKTAERLADWFKGRDEIKTVYYPKYSQRELYDKFVVKENVEGHKGGFGGLLAIVLKDHVCEQKFYDALRVSKVS